MLLITDGITGSSELKSNCCCDITRVNSVELLSLIRMHLKDTSNTLFFIFCCIENVRTCCHTTGVYTEECKFTYEWISHDLEC